MKTNFKKKILLGLLIGLSPSSAIFSQTFNWTQDNSDAVAMTWNKDTPEQEMKEDIAALKKKGITLNYSDVKRNKNGEITAIKIEYLDSEGNSGTQSFNGNKPISTIKFYKNEESIGFGESYNQMAFAFQDINFDAIEKKMRNHLKMQPKNDLFFSIDEDNFSTLKPKSKTNIIIQKSGAEPLIIENGKVIKGNTSDFQEELKEINEKEDLSLKNEKNKISTKEEEIIIKEENEMENEEENEISEDSKPELTKRKSRIILKNGKVLQEEDGNSDEKDTQIIKEYRLVSKNEKEANNDKEDHSNKAASEELKELKKARKEMQKIKEEMQKAKEELEKARTELKTRKI